MTRPKARPGAADEAIEAIDLDFVKQGIELASPLLRTYFRFEQDGIENVPEGPTLIVSNHSGGLIALDFPIFAIGFYGQRGYDEPVFCLAQDVLFQGRFGDFMRRIGLTEAHRQTAHEILTKGHKLIVFPGGDYDASRPLSARNTIDFDGRTGYVRTAIEAGVPITPMVTVGGQETQLFLSRGRNLVKFLRRLGFPPMAKYMPVSVGFPFGVTTGLPPNIPLPAKLTSSVLPPIDPKDFGATPDIDEIDVKVREVMQAEVDRLAAQRTLPFFG